MNVNQIETVDSDQMKGVLIVKKMIAKEVFHPNLTQTVADLKIGVMIDATEKIIDVLVLMIIDEMAESRCEVVVVHQTDGQKSNGNLTIVT